MSASKNLGKVFMTPKGIWDTTLNYTKLDIVTNKVGKISCGYIATTDIEKNVEITDNRWLKLFELLDGDLTEEYKAVQTDVTNKATDVDTNKKAVDLIYSQMQKLYDVEISTTTPTNERTGLWINPDDISDVINIPEIKDDEVSDVDTWSSKKIDNVTGSLKEDISTKITKFYASSQGETHITDSDNGKIQDMMIYGKSSQDGTPTPENPVEIKSVVNPTIKIVGKNLLNATLQTTTQNGVTCTANGDGTYTLNGTATERTEFIIDVFNIDISKKYKLIAFTKERSYINCFVQLNQSPWTIYGASTDSQVTITDSKNIRLVIAVIKGTTLSNEIIKPMIVDASLYPDATYDDFEPYHEQTVTLPYTLNAIPVETGGNVTIDGQQYIADYVDVERGKLVRMVGEFVQNNQEWRTEKIALSYSVFSAKTPINNIQQNDDILNYCSNYFKCIATNKRYSENTLFINSGYILIATMPSGTIIDDFLELVKGKLKVFYALATPIETDLITEEVTAFKSLATYYPTTNISINSEQLDGYTVFNYPISMENGWNYVKQQIGDTRDYIYDMDIQSAEAYVNSEYAVALTELEV